MAEGLSTTKLDITDEEAKGKDTHEPGESETDAVLKSCVNNSSIPKSTEMPLESQEVEFKSPNQFALPLSLSSAGKSKKSNTPSTNTNDEVSDGRTDQEQVSEDKGSDIPKQQLPSPYKEPEWSGIADDEYSFDVLKNGSIIGTVPLSSKPYHVFGRLPSCDVTLEHPSLSRYHAVVQYSAITTPSHDKGWYVYDLDSTHGTWVNKKKIVPKVYHRLRVGHIVKFGGSSRLHILQGPRDDEEEESEMTITEMKEQKEKLEKQAELLKQVELQEEMQRREEEQKLLEDRGCAWGMGDDAEELEGENPYANLVPENESLYIDDPKKALKGFYEREGCDLPDYQFTEVAMGKHKCRLDLPVDGPNGEELVAEAVVSGKRKDAVVACALEACRMLDKMGLLRSSTHESRKRKQKKWEDDDFYDSDEDTFLDRTGTIEKKRFMRMKKAGKDEPETYESLMEKYNTVTQQIHDIEGKLQKAKEEAEALASEEIDELDAYMMSIKSGAMDTKTRMQLKSDLLRLKAEEQKLRKLVNIAQPASLPPLKPLTSPSVPSTPKASNVDALSRKLLAQQKQLKKVTPVRTQAQVELKPDDYEEEEEEEENEVEDQEMKDVQSSPADSLASQVKHYSQDEVSRRSEADVKNSHVKGPTLPPQVSETKMKEPSVKEEDTVGKKHKPSHPLSTAAVLSKLEKKQGPTQSGQTKKTSSYDESDPDYAMWLPPTEQSGDGRTSLNDKLGY